VLTVVPTTGACAVAVQDQIQGRDRRAEPAGARTRASARGAGTSNNAIKAATALTIQRFMVFASPSWVQPQKDASTGRSRLPWHDGNN